MALYMLKCRGKEKGKNEEDIREMIAPRMKQRTLKRRREEKDNVHTYWAHKYNTYIQQVMFGVTVNTDQYENI